MLKNKIALVTGASRGIGKAVAKELAAQGVFVIVNYNGSKEAAGQVVSEIKASGGKAVSYQCDVSKYADCEQMVTELLKEYQKIDILVNNAGALPVKSDNVPSFVRRYVFVGKEVRL